MKSWKHVVAGVLVSLSLCGAIAATSPDTVSRAGDRQWCC